MRAEVEAARVGFDVVVDGGADLAAAVAAALGDGGRADVFVLFFCEAAEEAPVYHAFVVDWGCVRGGSGRWGGLRL